LPNGRDRNILSLDWGGGYIGIHIYQTKYLKWVYFITYKLYLNKYLKENIFMDSTLKFYSLDLECSKVPTLKAWSQPVGCRTFTWWGLVEGN
jgi:hypothetical protein